MAEDNGSDKEALKNELNKYIVSVQKLTHNDENEKEIYFVFKDNKNNSGITSIEKFQIYSTFILTLLVLIYYIFSFYKTEVADKMENVLISEVFESDYFFDGENLSKDISIVISNNSEVSVSIININIEREFEDYSFNATGDTDLPINMTENSSITKVVTIYFDINETAKSFIINKYGYNCEIDTYELDSYLESDEDIKNENNIIIRPGISVGIITSKGKTIRYERSGGAGGHF